jgi:hypothetical protein
MEAREAEGQRVTYAPTGGPVEHGTITGFSTAVYIFVRYDGDRNSKATDPALLELEGS